MSKDLGDVTHIIKRIFDMTTAIHAMRESFEFSKNDARAKRDRDFIAYWESIKDGNNK